MGWICFTGNGRDGLVRNGLGRDGIGWICVREDRIDVMGRAWLGLNWLD